MPNFINLNPQSNPNAGQITLPIIGIHRSPLSQKFGIPRQPNLVNLPTFIEILAPYNQADAFLGIEEFSHLWVSWQFHALKDFHSNNSGKMPQNASENPAKNTFRPQIRPPRLGGNKKIGVFASRSMYRPSRLGLSVVKFERLEVSAKGLFLHIQGADMLDGTPIVDIKPYLVYSDSIAHAQSGYATDYPLKKAVYLSEAAQDQWHALLYTQAFKPQIRPLTSADLDYIQALIAQDPRPAYRQNETDRNFVMRYAHLDVHFYMNANHEMIITQLIEF